MKLYIQAICHKGLVRENNEDAVSIGGLFLRDDDTEITVTTLADGFFYLLVSDGMGGHEMGEEASQYTLETLSGKFSNHEISADNFEDDLRDCIYGISSKLNERAVQTGQTAPMGCTLTGIIWHYGRTWLVNAGDSRTYRFREGMLRQLTTDETARGISGDPEASKLLLNCVGGGAAGHLKIESLDDKLLEGDQILVCSDGLCDMVTDDEIEEIIGSDGNIVDLMRKACENGGADNISIILAKVISQH
ncbi:MAG: PP2C family protein-serine/threonine phosphatase [Candidatus Cryptobacteroides sp.]